MTGQQHRIKIVLILFGIAIVTIVGKLGTAHGESATHGMFALTPRAYLPLVGAGPNSGEASTTPTPTPTNTPQAGPFDQVHLAWTGNSATSLVIVWRTWQATTPSQVHYRAINGGQWQIASGGERPSTTAGTLHEVSLEGLSPNTAYEYRVRTDGGGWSAPFNTRTAPAAGAADFDAVYMADTGLVGRTDGLASGTQQVIDEIARLQPLVILGGGDYAYFDSDKRYGTLDGSVDAWFNQMQPLASQSPLMPTYGNHEIELQEDYETWAARFPTPLGFNNRRNYSFDVANVHFISVFAPYDWKGVSSDQIGWLEQDVAAAKDRGMLWIIPYFHVPLFGDGKNHGPNLMLRGQLGPVFERLGIKIVLVSHDQSYERSFPLADVPATNQPTSSSLTCYTMADGVTYVKVSPGGKESNISGAFSPFVSSTLPSWTAVRDNTMHHFARLRVSATGSLRVEGWGVMGDGSPPVLLDSFRYTTGTCPQIVGASTSPQ